MQNYHKHDDFSNIFVSDSTANIESYAKRAVELGHGILSSVAHGWQSEYYEVYEMALKYNLKFVFGTEAYWVIDRHQHDNTNCHIIILAKNENGRRAINNALSTANEDGYYYKPRLDLELLLNLPANDVFVTTACLAFWKYDNINEIILKLFSHFKNNFMLEIQNHTTNQQIEINKRIKVLSDKYGIEMIVGLDSHYIDACGKAERDLYLAAKKIEYPEEDGWYMDYPDDITVVDRFMRQGVFSKKEIAQAMNNTDIILGFDDITFNKEIKMVSLYQNLTQDEKNKIYCELITQKYREYIRTVPKEDRKRYWEGVNNEVQVYKNTKMVDYPLLDYAIVQEAIANGGIITNTGRGSGAGFFTNTLCGFSKVDRFTSPIKLYPERFISESRILETKSLPDLDMNLANPEIFEAAQAKIVGADHSYPMIAYGKLKLKSAFKMYARASNLDYQIANEVTKQIDQYEKDLKFADDDEKDLIVIEDYVEKKYLSYIQESEKYQGIIDNKSKAPCAYLIYSGSIREEIGLIRCKSESSKREFITTVIDGKIAENYKFLKNDLLKVDVVLLIDMIYKRIGIEPHNVNQLSQSVKNDDKVWSLFENGYTIGLNQCERSSTTRKLMRYKPKNISELACFIAAIRPGFKSMYDRFESREHFEYGIPAFDRLIQTEEMPVSFMFFQEQVMATLNYAGFPMDECYAIIKAIAKKHPEKVLPLKSRFIDGFKSRIMIDDGIEESVAQNHSEKVWQIISDNCAYGFNSAHAYCMALDCLYNAWQKANHPYEFYECMMQVYSAKGKKDKVTLCKTEMKAAFGISEGKYRFRLDNRRFVSDKEKKCINPALVSLKDMSRNVADQLYELKDKHYKNFFHLLEDLKHTCINKTQLDILIKINYFEEFGEINTLLYYVEMFKLFYGKSQIKKQKLISYSIRPSEVSRFCIKETDITLLGLNYWDLLDDIASCDINPKPCSLKDKVLYQLAFKGYVDIEDSSVDIRNAVVISLDTTYSPKATIYYLNNGKTGEVKFAKYKSNRDPDIKTSFADLSVDVGDIIYLKKCKKKPSTKLIDGEWTEIDGKYDWWMCDYSRSALNGS